MDEGISLGLEVLTEVHQDQDSSQLDLWQQGVWGNRRFQERKSRLCVATESLQEQNVATLISVVVLDKCSRDKGRSIEKPQVTLTHVCSSSTFCPLHMHIALVSTKLLSCAFLSTWG